ncbi:hypothetical protein [Spelaeicoccus albus]|uniref:Uncharacterized protein n=1 Tax=Spelaeicoccus albus TaxID=1280376 RepID=A0A7Z0A9I8_9MICO|nr:hypothetical protein [Spelaeicoccus albus]NYI66078.1 hypothetical protein [Spelaeicoccus albus]
MITKKNRTSKVEELRRQLEEAEKAERARDKAEGLALRRAKKAAGDNHTRLALSLYDLLGVEPEQPTIRVIDGERKTVAVDKDESLRSQRLFDMVEEIVEKADPSLVERLKRADNQGRNERKPKAKKGEDEKPKNGADEPKAQRAAGVAASSSSQPAPTAPSPTNGQLQESGTPHHQPA